MTRQQEAEPLAAFIAALADLGRRTRSRRVARSRGSLARGVRDDGWVHPRRPSDYVAIGIVVGSTGAFALVALGRRVRVRLDGGPGGTQSWSSHVRQRLRTDHGAQGKEEHGDDRAGVTTMDPAGRPARHTSGAA